MRLFSRLMDKVLRWSRHRHAPYYLAGLSFAESSVFPIPPDVMLIPMSLATPHKAWRFALLTSIASVIGGMFGYLIGAYFFHFIEPYLIQFGYMSSYQEVCVWFRTWGFWVVFLAGFSPIPYKLFTIGAGAMQMLFLPFVVASLISRSLRFYLVSAAMYYGGERLQGWLYRYIDRVGLLFVLLAVVIYFLY